MHQAQCREYSSTQSKKCFAFSEFANLQDWDTDQETALIVKGNGVMKAEPLVVGEPSLVEVREASLRKWCVPGDRKDDGIRTGKEKVVPELKQDKHMAFEAEAEVQFDWRVIRYHGIWSHLFMANRWGNNGNSERLYFGGSKITADGDCSHEIKRRLLLGRKVMTNLDRVLKVETLLCQERSI